MRAVRVRLESPTVKTEPEWLPLDRVAPGRASGAAAPPSPTARPEVAVPFRVTLLKFNSDKYPGSSMAATYESCGARGRPRAAASPSTTSR